MQHQNFDTTEILVHGTTMVVLLCLLLISSKLSAQNAELSSKEKVQMAFNQAINIYERQIGRNSIIYTGSAYYDPYNTIKGNQFFIDEYWEYGSVSYDGDMFDSLFLMYDIYQDLLLVENFNTNGFLSPIILYSPKVSTFHLNGFDFIRVEKDTISNIKEGFYNLMYDGEYLQVLVKRRKDIVKSNEVNAIQEEFAEKDRYYIKKDGKFYQVRKRRSILKVLNDRKKEVKALIRENNYLFNNNPELQLVEVAKYYDSLN